MKCVLRIHAQLSDIPALAWDELVRDSHGGVLHPALRHAFLNAMERSGDISERTGWIPRHIALYDETGCLRAAAPAYLKFHSYGEYVFDWAWADAYHRHQLEYYPKLLTAIPFTPVFGNRLLAADAEWRNQLGTTLLQLAREASTCEEPLGWTISSWHGLFMDAPSLPNALAEQTLQRDAVQFHWQNRTGEPWPDFAAFLAALNQKKRKNILAERRKVREAGLHVQTITGYDAAAADVAFFYRCYANTYREHRSTPYLSLDFFQQLVQDMPEAVIFFIARRGDVPVAASLCLQSETTLYGRYWGALESVPCLHFETAYYAPLEWAIARGLQSFEGGAQGEHKMHRGFLPVAANSRHWLAHPAFADAIERYLQRESGGMSAYLEELEAHAPYRHLVSQSDTGNR